MVVFVVQCSIGIILSHECVLFSELEALTISNANLLSVQCIITGRTVQRAGMWGLSNFTLTGSRVLVYSPQNLEGWVPYRILTKFTGFMRVLMLT